MILHEVMARLHSGGIDQYAKTGVFVPEHYTDANGNKKVTWKDGLITVPRIRYADPNEVRLKSLLDEAKARLSEIETRIGDTWTQLQMQRMNPPKGWLQSVVDGNPKKTAVGSLCEVYESYVNDPRLHVAPATRKQYLSLLRNLRRYEDKKKATIYLDTITTDTLIEFEKFMIQDLRNSQNTASRRLKRLRSFIRWANGLNRDWPIEPITHNNPFERFRIASELYGTPYYLTIEERNTLAEADLQNHLATQRDIFVFQSLIGCRVSDLLTLTKHNVIDGAIEYIPAKTIGESARRVRVPLNGRAKAILDKHQDNPTGKLLPFISAVKYNKAIKDMIKAAGITRMVTIIDPTTRKETKRPIYEVASSHMARRTFIGNLYKQVKDPNLVGKLSGHAEGSRAFTRYRDIDEDMAKELVSMLE